jgi:hypothetical protein
MLIPDMIWEGNASKLLLGQIDSSLHASLLLRTLNNPHGRTDTSVGRLPAFILPADLRANVKMERSERYSNPPAPSAALIEYRRTEYLSEGCRRHPKDLTFARGVRR